MWEMVFSFLKHGTRTYLNSVSVVTKTLLLGQECANFLAGGPYCLSDVVLGPGKKRTNLNLKFELISINKRQNLYELFNSNKFISIF